jgi:hypothetical protein
MSAPITELGQEVLKVCPSPKSGRSIGRKSILQKLYSEARKDKDVNAEIESLIQGGFLTSLTGGWLMRSEQGDKAVAKARKQSATNN